MRLIDWLKNGNDCERCKCFHCERTSYEYEEYDCGCAIKGDAYEDGRCRVPRFVRWIMSRRAQYYENHQYDGIGEFYEELEQKNEKCREAIKKAFGGYVLCIKFPDGTLHECNTEAIFESEAWSVRDACEPEFTLSPTLSKRWSQILYDTAMFIPRKIKPFVCK